jgi:hypothetical protein
LNAILATEETCCTGEIILGAVIVVVVVAILLAFTIYARRTIEKIASGRGGTARETIKELTSKQ